MAFAQCILPGLVWAVWHGHWSFMLPSGFIRSVWSERNLVPVAYPCRPIFSLLITGALLGGAGAGKPALAQDGGSAGRDERRIVPDELFEESLPAINPDPAAEMGSLSEWEAEFDRLSDEAELADDPELSAPLEPLAEFETRSFDEASFAGVDEDRAPEIRYQTRIEGLDDLSRNNGASGNGGASVSAADIRHQFNELSVLAEGKGRAANTAMIELRLREDRKLLADVLASHGYYDARVRARLDLPDEEEQGSPAAVLIVRPGQRYTLGTIHFDAPVVEPVDLIARAFYLQPGAPLVAERILSAEAGIALALPQNGYPFVEVGQRDILLDEDTGTADYTLPVTPGPRVNFGRIVTGDRPAVFDADHIATIARFDQGDLYDSRKVDDLRRALIATGLFSSIAVEPVQGEMGEMDERGDESGDALLMISQEAGPPRTIAGQAGYATGQGFKVEASWTHRNMFPPEGALILNAVAGTKEQGAGAVFRRSNAGRRDRTVEFGLNVLRSDYDAYEAYTGRLSGRISRDSTPIWHKKWTYSYGFELLWSREQDYDPAKMGRSYSTYHIGALPAHVTYDTTGSLFDPSRGVRASARISPEISYGRGTQVYGQMILDASAYQPFSDSFVLASRIRLGMIAGADRENIAPSRRFYGGGGGSVRGFGYQELGPKDPDNRPIGGRSIVEAAGEIRYRFGDYGIVGFVDAGQVYTSQVPRFSDWRFGAGIGGRFYTDFGPMRLDVATPIKRRPGESRISVYVSIGQAF